MPNIIITIPTICKGVMLSLKKIVANNVVSTIIELTEIGYTTLNFSRDKTNVQRTKDIP